MALAFAGSSPAVLLDVSEWFEEADCKSVAFADVGSIPTIYNICDGSDPPPGGSVVN